MRNDSRLSRALHALMHMAQSSGPLTSDALATMLGTHAVVVRRLLAGLREAGYVRAGKGHGGGWVLSTPLSAITLLDIYRAVGQPPLFSDLVSEHHPQCLIEQSINHHLADALMSARQDILDRFATVTLDMLGAAPVIRPESNVGA